MVQKGFVMGNRIYVVTGFIVILLGLSSLSSTGLVTNLMPIVVNEARLSDIAFEQLIADPNIDIEPDVEINGASDEFSYSYHPISVDANDSYIELVWNHTANTSLDFSGRDPDLIFPDYNDFIYTYQEFEWPYEERPEDGNFYFNISTILTGDFANYSIGGNLMFREYLWVIDSSGNWIRIYESREATYSEVIQEKRGSINYITLFDIFDGMIEEDGVQEDPSDIARVVFGLAPSYRFEDYSGGEPWTYYEGSVSFRIHSVEFSVFREIEPNPETHLVPQYNETYGAIFSDIYPEATDNATEPLTDRLYAIISDPAGNIYLTGESSIGYNLFMSTNVRGNQQFLIKYNPALSEQWVVKNNNLSRGRAITYHDGSIYTTGCYSYLDEQNRRNVVVTKWTTSGQKIWETEWGGLYDQVGVAIGVHNDGSIYVMVSDYNYEGPEPWDCYDNSSLLKFDNSGTLLWNRSTQLSTLQDVPGEMRVYDSEIFYSMRGLTEYLDLDGNILSQNYGGYAVSDDEGAVYTARDCIEYLEVRKIDADGLQVWNESYQIEYPSNQYEWVKPIDIALTPSGELVILTHGSQYDYSYFLIQYNQEGELLQTQTIGDDWWPTSGEFVTFIEVASTDQLYCAYSLGDVKIHCYLIGSDSGLGGMQDIVLLVEIGGGIAVVVIIGIYFTRKRRVV